MTIEQYNQLPYDYAHCAGNHCEKASQCLRHTAYTMLETGGREQYMMVNTNVIADKQPCPFFDPNSKERFAWGISRIYDNVRASDLRGVKLNVMSCFGSEVYYKVKQQRRAITEEE